MSKGIIYVMTTVVDGLVKIGKTNTDNFTGRMRFLEKNGYANITGLKRKFAIEVDDFDEKETMLDNIFDRSRLGKNELFALDIDLVVQLLSSFEGRQVYPRPERVSKEKIFEEVTTEIRERTEAGDIPDGSYYMSHRPRGSIETIEATMIVRKGKYVLPAGTPVCSQTASYTPDRAKAIRDEYVGRDGKLIEDIIMDTPSAAGAVVVGGSCNGWDKWHDAEGTPIGKFRNKL